MQQSYTETIQMSHLNISTHDFDPIVIPMYFKQSKYISFMRKLKRWGFTRVTTGAEQGAFYHKVSYACEFRFVRFAAYANRLIRALLESATTCNQFFQRDNPLLYMQMTCVANYPEEGNRLSLLAQEEASTCLEELNSIEILKAETANRDIKHFPYQKAILDEKPERLNVEMGIGVEYDSAFKNQQQTFQITLEEKDKQKAEEMLMFEKE